MNFTQVPTSSTGPYTQLDIVVTAISVAFYLITIIVEICAIHRIKQESNFKWVK